MKIELDLQTVMLDFWLNRLMTEKYGTRISTRVVYDKIYLFWWKGTVTKGKWIKIGEGKIKVEVTLPSPKEIHKIVEKEAKK